MCWLVCFDWPPLRDSVSLVAPWSEADLRNQLYHCRHLRPRRAPRRNTTLTLGIKSAEVWLFSHRVFDFKPAVFLFPTPQPEVLNTVRTCALFTVLVTQILHGGVISLFPNKPIRLHLQQHGRKWNRISKPDF